LRGFVGEFMILSAYRHGTARQRSRLDRLGVHPLASQMSFEVLLAHLANGLHDPTDAELAAAGRLGKPTLIVTGRGGDGMQAASATRLRGFLLGSRLLVLEQSEGEVEPQDLNRFAKGMRRFLEGKDDGGR
jgi:hypothetical protein